MSLQKSLWGVSSETLYSIDTPCIYYRLSLSGLFVCLLAVLAERLSILYLSDTGFF